MPAIDTQLIARELPLLISREMHHMSIIMKREVDHRALETFAVEIDGEREEENDTKPHLHITGVVHFRGGKEDEDTSTADIPYGQTAKFLEEIKIEWWDSGDPTCDYMGY
ncbi:hypothetical protein F4809DRAFT_639369 [Biscogniauxia mediterranea]|nr:hypothetical protein F4809DRAFT_639369 [Biscogniauxia mediterranea]